MSITIAIISILKQGKTRAIPFSTLDAICSALDYRPGDIFEYRPWDANERSIRDGMDFTA